MAKQQEYDGEVESPNEESGGRPAATQVISTRLPSALTAEIAVQAARRGVRSSDLVRLAVEAYMRHPGVAGVRANSGGNLRLDPDLDSYSTENDNPVVQPAEVTCDPPGVVAIGL
jgi:hypothetical protein